MSFNARGRSFPSLHRMALTCAHEAGVDVATARKVLKGEAANTLSRQRVVTWCKQNGISIPVGRKPVEHALAEIDAMLPKDGQS